MSTPGRRSNRLAVQFTQPTELKVGFACGEEEGECGRAIDLQVSQLHQHAATRSARLAIENTVE